MALLAGASWLLAGCLAGWLLAAWLAAWLGTVAGSAGCVVSHRAQVQTTDHTHAPVRTERARAVMAGVEGQQCPDITLVDSRTGEEKQLSSFTGNGKMTVIDFYTSW